jgi:hypothetical protein
MRAAADPRPRQSNHWDRQLANYLNPWNKILLETVIFTQLLTKCRPFIKPGVSNFTVQVKIIITVKMVWVSTSEQLATIYKSTRIRTYTKPNVSARTTKCNRKKCVDWRCRSASHSALWSVAAAQCCWIGTYVDVWVTAKMKLTRMSAERFTVRKAVSAKTALRKAMPCGLLRIYQCSTVIACRWRQKVLSKRH